MARKKSFLQKFFTGFGKLIAWIIVSFFKSIWFLLKGLVLGVINLVKFSHKSIKHHHEASKIKASQPKTPAKYDSLSAETVVKGSIDNFERRLLNESLIVAIAGRRGSGKSVLGFRLMENMNAKNSRPCFALGVKQSVLPVWINSIEDINEVSNQGVVLVDEGAVSFSSRESMSKGNRGLAPLLAVARHKDLTLIFITQNTGMIDKNVLNLCDTVILKEGSLLQERMERSVMKDLYKTANDALSKIDSTERKAFCYVVDVDFEGLVKVSLPSFWSQSVSKNRA